MRSTSAAFAVLLVVLVGCAASASESSTDGEADLEPVALLGKRLFEDPSLSEPAGQSCASCHDASRAFTGNAGAPIDAVAAGRRAGALGSRNVPTAMYASFSPAFAVVRETDESGKIAETPTGGQFWDGRAASLVDQAKGPFLNPREMANPDKAAVVEKVKRAPYAALFREVYGAGALDDVDAAYDKLASALAAFEETDRFAPFSSKFDAFLRGQAVLSEEEAWGFRLFKDPEKGNCIACHVGDEESRAPADWLFTDFTFDALGVPRNAKIPDNADPAHFDLGLCEQPGFAEHAPPGFDVSSTCGAFKVPTLRNIERTAPYMHNGYFTDLRDVVRFYVTRDTSPELWYPRAPDGSIRKFDDLPEAHRKNVNVDEPPYDRKPGEAPRLDDAEIDAVVAFLKTLTDR